MKIDKYKRLVLFLFAGILLASSCADDKGNYDYIDLNNITIDGISKDITALSYANLEITPVFKNFDPTEDQYDFEWQAIQMFGDGETEVIGTNKNLNYTVELLPGAYTLLYTIKEKGSEIYYREEMNLQVNSVTSEGWLVLSSDNNRARLDMVSKITGETYHDLLAHSDMPEMHGPRSITFLPPTLTDAASPFYLFADDGATRLSNNEFEWQPEFDMSYEMGDGKEVRPYSISTAYGYKMLVSGTKAHFNNYTTQDGFYSMAVNKDYNVAPTIGVSAGSVLSMVPTFLMYDTDNKQFMAYCWALPVLYGINADIDMNSLDMIGSFDGNAFQEFPVGLEYVYMENTRYSGDGSGVGTTYTILREGNNFYLYGLQLGDLLQAFGAPYVVRKSHYGDLSGCTDIAKAEHFAFSSLKNYMYYSVKNQVYRVNLSNTPFTAEPQFSLSGEDITCLKFYLYTEENYANRSYDLIVGSQKGGDESTSGILRVYDGLETEGDFSRVQPKETHEGFGKIVDIIFREIITVQ